MQSPWQQNQWPLERWIRQELSTMLRSLRPGNGPANHSWLPIGCMLFFSKRLGFMLRHGVSGETSTSRPVYSCFRCGVILTNRAELAFADLWIGVDSIVTRGCFKPSLGGGPC